MNSLHIVAGSVLACVKAWEGAGGSHLHVTRCDMKAGELVSLASSHMSEIENKSLEFYLFTSIRLCIPAS